MYEKNGENKRVYGGVFRAEEEYGGVGRWPRNLAWSRLLFRGAFVAMQATIVPMYPAIRRTKLRLVSRLIGGTVQCEAEPTLPSVEIESSSPSHLSIPA